MKCDKLQQVENPIEWGLYYDKNEVDAAIDELKREHHRERHEYIDWVNRLQKENAELKEVYKDSVDVKVKIWERYKKAEDELRNNQRALWLARADRAVAEQTVDEWSRYKEKHPFGLWREDPFEYWVQAWIYVEKLCRNKAKEYK